MWSRQSVVETEREEKTKKEARCIWKEEGAESEVVEEGEEKVSAKTD